MQTCTNCDTLNADSLLSEDLVIEPKVEPKLKPEPPVEPKVESVKVEKTTQKEAEKSTTTPAATPSSSNPTTAHPTQTISSFASTSQAPTTTPNPVTTQTPATTRPPLTTSKPNKNNDFTIPDIEILPPKETIHLKFPRPENLEPKSSTTERPSTKISTTLQTTTKPIEIDDKRDILVGELPTENQLNSEDEPIALFIKLPTPIESSAVDKDTEITPPSTEPHQLPKLPENEIPTVPLQSPTTTEKSSVEERNSRIISETSSTTTAAPADVIVKKLIPDTDESLENPRPKAFIRSIESGSSPKTTSPKPIPTVPHTLNTESVEAAATKEPQKETITKGPKKTKSVQIPILDPSAPELLPVIEKLKISLPQILGLSPPPPEPETEIAAQLIVATTSTTIPPKSTTPSTISTTEIPTISKAPFELLLNLSPPPIVPLIPIRDYTPPNYTTTETPQTQKSVVIVSTTTTQAVPTTQTIPTAPVTATVTTEPPALIEKKLIENTLPLIVKDIFSIPIPKVDVLDEAPPPPSSPRTAKQIQTSTPAPFSSPNPSLKRESGHRFNSSLIKNVVAPSLEIADMLYKFNYTTGFHGHDEHGNSNGMKKGGYFIIGRDNIKRTVTYVASKNGFVPSVRFGLVKPEEAPNKDTERDVGGVKNQEFKWFIENPKSKNLIR